MVDDYSIRARLSPAMLALLPAILGAVALLPTQPRIIGWVGGTILWAGVGSLLVQVARDRGARLQEKLFRDWGGSPTLQLLRFRVADDAKEMEERHSSLRVLFPDLALPTRLVETKAPEQADLVYEQCISRLRELTRDAKTYPIVFAENVSYGFRRNLLGMKPIGLVMCALGVLPLLLDATRQPHISWNVDAVVSLSGSLLMLGAWLLVISPSWVRVAADRYAKALFATLSTLTRKRSP